MPERNGSAESIDEFFGASNIDNDNDDKKTKQNDISPTSAVAALIKSQPVVHHRQTSLEKKPTNDSKKMPLTTNVKNTSTQSKHVDSPPSKTYESDFDDNTSADDKKKHSSLPQSKQRSPETPHRASDSKLKVSYPITNNNKRLQERFLPYIRTKSRKKRLQKEAKGPVDERILSARNEKLSELRSRYTELRRQLEEERFENKTLRLIQKREEQVLKKYDDQDDDVDRVARDYRHEIEDVKKEITNEREMKTKLQKEIEDRDESLRDQTKRMKFYEKLVYEPNLDEPDNLREKLKEIDKQLKIYQEKIANKEKYIQNLEKTYRHEIHQELVKQRDIKNEIQNHSKKYTDLLLRLEQKSRQVGTMHIYIQRGGRRPSYSSSMNLSKSRSLQSLQDTSPRFREKIQEYDKRRREEQKFMPKPKPKPLPINPPPKRERQKYVPNIVQKPKLKPTSVPVHDEKPPIIEKEYLPPKDTLPVRRISTPRSFDEDKSEIENDTIIESTRQKPPSPPTNVIQRNEQNLSEAPVHKRPLTPVSPLIESKLDTDENTTTSNLLQHTEPPPPPVTHESDDKWLDILDTNKKEESTKDDLLSKLITDEQQERKSVTITKPSPPSSQRPSMIMFEPSSITTNVNQKKPPTRTSTTNVYDFDQAVVNLHEGKPVTTQPATTKTFANSFEALFDNNTTKPIDYINSRDDTFTITQDQPNPFDTTLTQSSSEVNSSTIIKPNSRQISSQNDKLQRPKVVTNVPKPIPNRTVVEEIEEFVL